ncbi:unnamed protein product, partial [Urochloa humidicola]
WETSKLCLRGLLRFQALFLQLVAYRVTLVSQEEETVFFFFFLLCSHFSHVPLCPSSLACADVLLVEMPLLIDDEPYEPCKALNCTAFNLQRE